MIEPPCWLFWLLLLISLAQDGYNDDDDAGGDFPGGEPGL